VREGAEGAEGEGGMMARSASSMGT